MTTKDIMLTFVNKDNCRRYRSPLVFLGDGNVATFSLATQPTTFTILRIFNPLLLCPWIRISPKR